MTKEQVANLLYRFFDWRIDGKPGDPVQGDTHVSACVAHEIATTVAMQLCMSLMNLNGC
jgi:hypothetical protein